MKNKKPASFGLVNLTEAEQRSVRGGLAAGTLGSTYKGYVKSGSTRGYSRRKRLQSSGYISRNPGSC